MKSYFTSKIWMNVKIFSFIVIFYVSSLIPPQKSQKLPWSKLVELLEHVTP
jgi:hypothetical protein